MMTTTRRRLLPALLLVTAFVARTLAFQSGVCSHQQLMQRTRPLSSTQRIVREQDATVFRRSALASQDGQEAVHTKQEVAVGYNRGKIVFGATAATVLVLPDCTNSALLASKVGGAAGFAVASGLCHILQGANENDRLGSDTYKRLNLGLLGFGVLGLAAVPGEAGFCTTAAPAMFLTVVLSAVRMFGAKVAWNGWERGVNPRDGRTNVLTELVQGTQSTLQGLKVQNRKKALSYANLLLLVGLGIVSSFMDGLFNIRVSFLAIN